MSNLETLPAETTCHADAAHPGVEVIEPRLVPLGGPRAMTVRRTLPTRGRSLVGPWCFLDHYGPDDVAGRAGMNVPPHPHTGLQTVTWLFAGDVEHRDSVGSVQTIRPGQLNLMTAGHGICHSEVSLPGTRVLHGVQWWVALPEGARHGAPAFEHHAALPVADLDDDGAGWVERTLPDSDADAFARARARAVVLMGSLAGVTSPATTYSPLVAAEITLPAGARVRLPVDPAFEHAVLVDTGEVTLDGERAPSSALAYVGPGGEALHLAADGPDGARLMLLGGEPFGEDILMWWNFVGRAHEEVVQARAEWQAGLRGGSARFGVVTGYDGLPLPAPDLPTVRLVPRSQR